MSAVLNPRPTITFQWLEAAFNTRRIYTKHGQRIAVWTVELSDGRKFFAMHDYDRDITHCFNHIDLETESELIRYVMVAYDGHSNRCADYQFTAFARELAQRNQPASLRFIPVSL